jgi:hypothetical protein
MSEERRCPNCRGLVTADAEWCGQCYARLKAMPEEPKAVAPGREPSAAEREAWGEESGEGPDVTAGAVGASKVVPLQARKGEPSWPCPACDEWNPIELDTCAACGTPFARLFREPDHGPEVSPQSALLSSLVFPGLGHWRCGKPFDGVARAVLFAWTLTTVAVIVFSRSGKSGFGATVGLLGLFLVATVLLYALSALDAYRIASGEHELVTSRILLWGSAGLVLLAAIIATLITLPSMQGG